MQTWVPSTAVFTLGKHIALAESLGFRQRLKADRVLVVR
jgi:hypothetical protein